MRYEENFDRPSQFVVEPTGLGGANSHKNEGGESSDSTHEALWQIVSASLKGDGEQVTISEVFELPPSES